MSCQMLSDCLGHIPLEETSNCNRDETSFSRYWTQSEGPCFHTTFLLRLDLSGRRKQVGLRRIHLCTLLSHIVSMALHSSIGHSPHLMEIHASEVQTRVELNFVLKMNEADFRGK